MASARSSLFTERGLLTAAAVTAAGCLSVLLGAAGPALDRPLLAPALALLALAAAAAIHLWGRQALLLGAVAITPLVPVADAGVLAGALGGHGSSIRSALLLGLLTAYAAGYTRGFPRLPVGLRAVVGSLAGLAGAGLFAAIVNAPNLQLLPDEVLPAVGQPVVYILLIVAVAAELRQSERARERLLAAFCIAVVVQGLIVGAEFATGASYDPVLGINRAQGTVGANFIAAMALLGLFSGLSLRAGSRSRRMVALGTLTIAASAGIVAVATSRGSLIGVVVGAGYLLSTGAGSRGRLALVTAAVGVLMAASLLTPVADLWTTRLALPNISRFDRAATWVSGARMGISDPLTGLGSAGVVEAVQTDPHYRQTPFGSVHVVPHNIWILAFAEGGVANLAFSIVFSVCAVLAVLRRPRRGSPNDRYLVAGLIGIGLVAVINNVFTHPELMVPSLVVLTILATGAAAERESSSDGRRGLTPSR